MKQQVLVISLLVFVTQALHASNYCKQPFEIPISSSTRFRKVTLRLFDGTGADVEVNVEPNNSKDGLIYGALLVNQHLHSSMDDHGGHILHQLLAPLHLQEMTFHFDTETPPPAKRFGSEENITTGNIPAECTNQHTRTFHNKGHTLVIINGPLHIHENNQQLSYNY